jgi:hypothetical protein
VRSSRQPRAAGNPRHPGDSPTGPRRALLAEQRVDGRVLAALLEVYRQPATRPHTVDDQMRAQARSALQHLRSDLGAGALQ